jgi:hypothetical protein
VILHFLLQYDHQLGKLVDMIEFGTDGVAAIKRYGELEDEYRQNPEMDIVLVGSDSLETIKITHRNYFDEGRTFDDIAEFLRKVPGASLTR